MSQSVSDGYMTVILLGAALCALAVARRVFARMRSHDAAEHPMPRPAMAEQLLSSKPDVEASTSLQAPLNAQKDPDRKLELRN